LNVEPSQATVRPGETRQFQITSTNLPNAAVRWMVSPQVGVIARDGTYTAPQTDLPVTATITAYSLSNPELWATATVTVSPAATSSTAAITGLTSAASFQPGPIAPGEIVTIFGTGLGPASTVTAQLDSRGNLASSLAGTQVIFDGTAAPLVYVSAQAVTAIVPYEIANQQSTLLTVTRNGQASPPLSLPVSPTAPAFFTADTSGFGQVAATNSDGSYNTPQNGAAAGSVIALYATGEGQTSPAGSDGRIANSVYPTPIAPVSVQIGGIDAPIVYAGAAPQAVAGLFQLNVTVPAGVPRGPNSIVLKVGNAVSRPDATITVR
jgi:uncharacterized protein (TIGR03437 family)